ncbi:deoxyhypusine synthase [Candidatus Micrarchaeota archaeon]|nr:deoxyhypusine synthase [Candidatus Micrarchaeota archaeon]
MRLPKKRIRDMKLLENMGAAELVEEMRSAGGFTARHLASGVSILGEMLADKECTNFLSFPACIVATGLRGALAQFIKEFDVVITTGGTFDHDLARAWGGSYFEGSFELDDEMLHRIGVNRLGNVLIPNSSYGIILERRMLPILKQISKENEEWSSRELAYEFGKRVDDKNSILYQAAKHNIPVYCPGILDGAFGTNLVIFSQDHKFKLNLIKDEKELSDIVFDSKRRGALMIGGGISKHHTIWWNQFKGGLDYAVYITTASQYDGSLSGARLREAISWGKVKERAKQVTIDGDATVILPLMLAALRKRK